MRVAEVATVHLSAPPGVVEAVRRALCAVPCGGPAGYRVRVAEVRPRAARLPLRRPGWWARLRRAGGSDRVVVPGGTVSIAPGVREAEVRLRSPVGAPPAGSVEVVGVALEHALALHGAAVLHAAAVEVNGVGMVVVGGREAGKSTLAAAVLASGGRVASDDAVVLDGPGMAVRPLRRDLWFRAGSWRLLPPGLARGLEEVVLPWERRWVLRRSRCGRAAADTVRPVVLVELRRDRRLSEFRVRRLAAGEALAALIRAGSPLFLAPRYREERAALLPVLARAAERLPAFEVRMGRGLLDEPAGTLASLVARLAPAGS